jgi:imidazole glycerol-phosphate synthase subunit HisH
MSRSVVLVDSGGSNLSSVQAALSRLGVSAPVTSDWSIIQSASHVILPGVGAANTAMQRLHAHDLVQRLPTLTQPVLGVCVGVQLLFASSEEASADAAQTLCLGVIDAPVLKLTASPGLRIPHMGWNQIRLTEAYLSASTSAQALLAGLDGAYAYFVHSFAAPLGDYTLASCTHGTPFSAVVSARNFYGAQFHPERSQAAGARLLQNFLALD